jgi:hypothetical protein
MAAGAAHGCNDIRVIQGVSLVDCRGRTTISGSLQARLLSWSNSEDSLYKRQTADPKGFSSRK